jgi:2'-5' RNA ligase
MFSYWLLPAEPTRSQLAAQIAELAREYSVTAFAPHITLFVSTRAAQRDLPLMAADARIVQPFSVHTVRVAHGPELFKSVFLQIDPNATLNHLAQSIRAQCLEPSDYAFDPHLSLIYKAMTEPDRSALAARLVSLVPTDFVCDALSLVVPSADGWTDIAGIREIDRHTFARLT